MGRPVRDSKIVHLGPVKNKRRQAKVRVSSTLIKKEELKYKVYYNKIVLSIATLKDRLTVKPLENGDYSFSFEICVGDEDWSFGNYLIDEDETNEDQIVFYKEDLIQD